MCARPLAGLLPLARDASNLQLPNHGSLARLIGRGVPRGISHTLHHRMCMCSRPEKLFEYQTRDMTGAKNAPLMSHENTWRVVRARIVTHAIYRRYSNSGVRPAAHSCPAVANCLPSAGFWESAAPYRTSPTCLTTVPSHTQSTVVSKTRGQQASFTCSPSPSCTAPFIRQFVPLDN